MNTPSRSFMRPLPHSTLGAVPEAVTRADLANGLSRLMAIGRTPVGNQAARKLLAMVDRYAETSGSPPTDGAPVAPTAAVEQLRSKLDWCVQDRQRWVDLAEQRNVAITELTDQAAKHTEESEVRQAEAQQARADFDNARAEVARLSKEAVARDRELDSVTSKYADSDRRLAVAERNVDYMLWLHAEATWEGRHGFDRARAEVTRLSRALDLAKWLHAEARHEFALPEALAERFFREMRAATERADLAETALAERVHELDVALGRLAQWEESQPQPFSVALTDGQIEELRARFEQLPDRAAVFRPIYAPVVEVLADEPAAPTVVQAPIETGFFEDERASMRPAVIPEPAPIDPVSTAEPEVIAEDVTGPVKRCGTCGEVKALSEFHLRSRHGAARHSACKECDTSRRRAWRAEKREEGK